MPVSMTKAPGQDLVRADPATDMSSAIRTPDLRLRVFVSSTLDELAPERAAASEAIAQLRLTPILFELGARPYPPRELYRAYLAQSDVFIGIYGQRYGWVAPGMDVSGLEDEYGLAAGMPKLIYVKAPAPDREPRLQQLLGRIRDDGTVSYRKVAGPDELRALIADDLAVLLTERFAGVGGVGAPPAIESAAPPALVPLSLPRDPLIGRARETTRACALLRDPGVGLVTLTGPGGVGKTRVALQVAHEMVGAFADGVVFVPLEAVNDPAEIIPAVAYALGVPEVGGRSLQDGVLQYMRGKQLLLLLDNVEQLVAAAPLAARALAAAPRLKLLVTSREALRVGGERVVPIPPLALPDPAHAATAAEVAAASAVALFVARAREARPDFALTGENAATVAEICRRLDGLPLALELAAARLTVLAPQAVLARLDGGLSPLGRGRRDLPARQRTLRDTIAWSYDLLDDADQHLFRALAVFAGGFTAEAAQAVYLAPPAADDAAADVLDRLTSLVDKSLVRAAPTDDDGTRFALLATLHGYALERLTASGDLAILQRCHAAYYTDVAEAAEPCLYLPDRAASLTLLDRAYDNLRAALTWATGGATMPDQAGARAAPIQPHAAASDAEAATAGERGDAEGRGDIGLRLAGDLAMYWFLRGRLQEGQAWIERVVAGADAPGADAPGAERTAARAWVLNGAGLIAVARGDAVTAVARAVESVAAFRELGDRGDKPRLAYAYLLLGTAHVVQGAPTAARAALEQGRIAHHEAGDPLGEVYEAAVLHYLGRAAHAAGDLAAARALYEQSLAIYRRIGDVVGRAVVLNVLGVVDAAQGESAAARAAFAESLTLVRTTGDRYDLAQFLVTVGTDLVQRGDRDAGRDLLAEGLRLWRDIGTPAGIARALAGLADLAAGEGQTDRAGRLFAAAARLSTSDDRPLNDTRGVDPDRTVAAARTASDDVTFKGGWSAGEALTEEEAIALALRDEVGVGPQQGIAVRQ